MNYFWKEIRFRFNKLLIDIGKRDSSVLLVGMDRSGTTWSADIINYRKDHRVLFEPFFPAHIVEALGFE